jgi:RNA polymerase sigma factor (TIGR02999 family)
VTRLLKAMQDRDADAFDQLLPIVYQELRQLARRQLRGERAGHTLETTGLVHEAYLKLVNQHGVDWQGRAHFFAVAARAMRQVLIDYARRRGAAKRGGGWERTTLDDDKLPIAFPVEELLTLNDALDKLDDVDSRLRQVVECRFFCGMTQGEIASALDVTPRTVERDWVKARAWLYRELYPEAS